MAPTYQLPTFTGALTHGWGRASFLRDIDDEAHYELDAQAQSGDYFVMLATELDTLSRHLTDYYVRSELESRVSDLIYLQDHYNITKKESE